VKNPKGHYLHQSCWQKITISSKHGKNLMPNSSKEPRKILISDFINLLGKG
jgi:hypothetical protein